jgi:ribonuclease P protein component
VYSRKFSLKSRYNFSRVLKSIDEYKSDHLIIKFRNDDRSKDPKFAVITSNRLSKKAVDQNKIRRIISKSVSENLIKFPENYNFIFIPKKTFFDKSGKIVVSAEEINSEINSFLSKVDFSRPKPNI